MRLLRLFAAVIAFTCGVASVVHATDVDGPNDCARNNSDFGDAPEGTAVLAYPGVPGFFPTCIAAGAPGTQNIACAPISTAPGPTGYVQHVTPAGTPLYWLGCPTGAAPFGIDTEADGKVNNSAVVGAPSTCSGIPTDCVEAAFGLSFGQDECFGSTDAGVLKPTLKICSPSTVSFTTQNCATVALQAFLNILVDMNRDGDWNDNFQCPGGCAYEWAVKNAVITLPPGCAAITSPAFLVGPNAGPAWMRVTISAFPVNDDFPWAGTVTMGGRVQGGETEDYPVNIRKPVVATLSPADIDWATPTAGTVRFHLVFRNNDPEDPSDALTGEIMSQRLGVFLPDYGPIGTFNVPELAPNSFFDVFTDVSLDQLPPSAQEILPWMGMMVDARAGGAAVLTTGCPPDDHWDGNVDINWSSPSGGGQVNKHIGTIQVCPAHGNSYIHALVFCTATAGASWTITGVCPGWSATLVNEGPPGVPDGPAPNPVPPGWTGYICISADATVAPGATCPIQVTFDCGGVPGTIDLRPVACDCVCDLGYEDWGDAPEQIASYPSGIAGHFPTCASPGAPGTQTVACPPISTPPLTTGFVHHSIAATDPLAHVWLGCGAAALGSPGIDGEKDGKVNTPSVGVSACADIPTDCVETAFGGMAFDQDECNGDVVDAGISAPLTFSTCQPSSVKFDTYNCNQTFVEAYLNILVDMNEDADWNDNFQCAGGCAYEWAVKNVLVPIPPGCNAQTSPTFLMGPNKGHGWLRITLSLEPVPDDFPWNGSAGLPALSLRGGETEDYPVEIQPSTQDPCQIGYRDFGDAPEELMAYADGTRGHFPTCTFATPPGTQELYCGVPQSTPPGPTGYVVHVATPTDPIHYWLGCGLPGAIGGIDSEPNGKVNMMAAPGTASVCDPNGVVTDCIESTADGLTFGQDECTGDGVDAGIASPVTVQSCTTNVLIFQAYNCSTVPIDVYVNVLFDWNQDGDWNDNVPCTGSCVNEWTFKNFVVTLAPGCNLITLPSFQAGPKPGASWMRLTLTRVKVQDDFPWNGSLGEPNGSYDGGETEDYPVTVRPSTVGVEQNRVPSDLKLAVQPNPSGASVNVSLALPREERVSLAVYDITGRRLATLAGGVLPAGERTIRWNFRSDDGQVLPAGLYLIRAEVGDRVLTKTLVRIR